MSLISRFHDFTKHDNKMQLFYWILSEFTSTTEQDLVGCTMNSLVHWMRSNENTMNSLIHWMRLMNCCHISDIQWIPQSHWTRPNGDTDHSLNGTKSTSTSAQYVTPISKIYCEKVKMCLFSSGNWFFYHQIRAACSGW